MIQDHKQSGKQDDKGAHADHAGSAIRRGFHQSGGNRHGGGGCSAARFGRSLLSPCEKPNEDSQHKSGGELRDKQDNPSLNAAQKSGAGYGYYKGRSGADREA